MVLFVNMIIYFPICHLYRSGNAGSVCCFLVPLLLAPFFEALLLSCPTLPYFQPAVPTLQLQTDNRSIQFYRYGIQPRTPLHCYSHNSAQYLTNTVSYWLSVIIRKTKPLGHYGRLRKAYLKMHRPILFNELVLSDKLFEHCAEIDEAARNRMELIVPELVKRNGVTEQLKAENQMEWVRQMNACKAQAEEIVKAELIYD